MIRVLVADESQRITDNVVQRLAREEDLMVCGTAKDGEYAVQEALRLQPDIALIDAGLPGLDGIQTTEMLAQHLPQTGVILMSMEGENEAYRHAMLAGAREFLQKPFKGDDLVAAIRRVHGLYQQRQNSAGGSTTTATTSGGVTTQTSHESPPPPTGRIFTVLAGKGGVGKSVIAANLAVMLAQAHRGRVALVDLSLQFGDIAALLNLPIERTIADLAANDAVADREVIQQVLIDGPCGVRVLLAPISPELADYVTTQHLRALMDELRRSFDHIVVDAPAFLNEITLDAIEMADEIVVLSDLSVTAVKNSRLILSVMDVLKIESHAIHVIANHHRGNGAALDRANAEQHLKRSIELEIPYDPVVVNTSISLGVPFVVDQPTAPVTTAIGHLAALLVPTSQGSGHAEQGAGAADNRKKDAKKKKGWPLSRSARG